MSRNDEFLYNILSSFDSFILTGSSRSTEKLKPLHGKIADDVSKMLGKDFVVISRGLSVDKESSIRGRYFPKKVDITIRKSKTFDTVAGIGVKFIMQNFQQNSNNYFENMLGETANIRTGNIPYFQIIIMFNRIPHYDKDGKFKKWELVTPHYLQKYFELAKDNVDAYYHTPNCTLLYIVTVEPEPYPINNKKDYLDFYLNNNHIITADESPFYSPGLSTPVIFNRYDIFLEKVYHNIKARW